MSRFIPPVLAYIVGPAGLAYLSGGDPARAAALGAVAIAGFVAAGVALAGFPRAKAVAGLASLAVIVALWLSAGGVL